MEGSGAVARIDCLLGAAVTVRAVGAEEAVSSNTTFPRAEADTAPCLATGVNDAAQGWLNGTAAGVLGLAPAHNSYGGLDRKAPRPTWLRLVATAATAAGEEEGGPALEGVLALDLAGGQLHLGGWSAPGGETVLWSEAIRHPARTSHFAALFDVRSCGRSVMEEALGQWTRAVVDTTATCLTLPARMLRALATWAPIECTHLGGGDDVDATKARCSLAAGTSFAQLPALVFSVAQGGGRLHLQLSKLVDPEGGVCLRSHGTDREFYQPTPPVILGTLALESLYTVFHVEEKRVGFASAPGAAAADDWAACAASREPMCRGDQTYAEASNACVDPQCSSYYFQVLSPELGRCELSPVFYTVLVVAFTLFAALDLLVGEGSARVLFGLLQK